MHAAEAPSSQTGWRPHALMLALNPGHAALFYGLAHLHTPGLMSRSPPLFGPIIAALWQPRGDPLPGRPWEPAA